MKLMEKQENKKDSRDKALIRLGQLWYDPSILESKAFKIIQEEYLSIIRKCQF